MRTVTTFVLVAGTTETAGIPGISGAGAPGERVHTPSADAEILTHGRPVRAPVVPVGPSGCPTPAVVTRAVDELIGLDPVVVDAGLAGPVGAPTVGMDATPGRDIRDREAVPDAESLYETAREFGASLPADNLVIGETIPAGTTTALAVLRALGERGIVSSSLPDNPVELKREVTDEALAASGLSEGDAAGEPLTALRAVGDPVLTAVTGLVAGCREADTGVTLAGGTQMATAGALARHRGIGMDLPLATTSFVADDGSADLAGLAAELDLPLTATDPAFDERDHPAMAAYEAGAAKEGVGMGGALLLAKRAGLTDGAVHDRILTVYDRLTEGAVA